MLSTLAGKYSSEIRPAFFLAILYMLLPCWAAVKIFSQSHAPTSYTPNMVSAPLYTVCERLWIKGFVSSQVMVVCLSSNTGETEFKVGTGFMVRLFQNSKDSNVAQHWPRTPQ